ncbi:hypothetical protein [Nonomuraea sp. NPDC050643]
MSAAIWGKGQVTRRRERQDAVDDVEYGYNLNVTIGDHRHWTTVLR